MLDSFGETGVDELTLVSLLRALIVVLPSSSIVELSSTERNNRGKLVGARGHRAAANTTAIALGSEKNKSE